MSHAPATEPTHDPTTSPGRTQSEGQSLPALTVAALLLLQGAMDAAERLDKALEPERPAEYRPAD